MLNSIIKDLKVNILDGKQMVIIIAMPVVLTVILSFALSGTFSQEGLSEPIEVAVVKLYDDSEEFTLEIEGSSDISDEELAQYMSAFEMFDPEEVMFGGFLDSDDIGAIMHYEIMTQDEAQAALDELSVAAIIYIPENFLTASYSNMFGVKEQIEFKVVADAGSSYKGTIVSQVMSAFSDSMSMTFANGEVYTAIAGSYLSEIEIYQNMQLFYTNLNALTSETSEDIKTESVDQYELVDSFTYYAIAMLCMFMLFSAGIGGRSMLEEKENITYYRMKVLGVTYYQMMVSKMVVVMVICLLQSAVMIGLSSMFFGVEWGSVSMIILIALCGSFAIGGLGSFIGAISLRSGNYKLANAFEGALVQVLALLGGSYIPLSVLPKFFTVVSKFTVNGEALSAYIKTAQGMGLSDITMEIMVMLLFGAVFFGAAWMIISSEGRKENA